MVKPTAQDIRDIQTAAQTSLKFLCKEILGMKDWGLVHDELERFLKTSRQRKHIELPRGHLKSSIVTKAWSIQQVLNNPNIRILIANAVWDNARKFLGSIEKYLAPGSLLAAYFGNFQSNHWNQDECTVSQRTTILDAPTWATTGIEKEQTSQHYDLIIADDLVAETNSETPEQRQKVFEYYQSLFDLLEPDGTMVVIGTRYHQDDLYARIIEENERLKNWDILVKAAYREDGAILYPEKFTPEILDEKRGRGAYHFASQYLNNPIDPGSSDFKREWITHYDPGTPHPASLYLAVDPAISLSRDADYTAMVVGGMFKNRRIRIVDYIHARLVPDALTDRIFDLVKKWNLTRMGIETFAFQKTLKYEIQRQQRERGIFFSIDELGRRHNGRGENLPSKNARIRRLQPFFEQGLFEIRRDMTAFEDELLAFPRGRHDDLLDATAYLLDYLVPSTERAPVRNDDYKWVEEEKQYKPTGNFWNKQLVEPQMTIYERFLAS